MCSSLKQVAKDVVLKVYQLLPDEKSAESMGPEAEAQYMKEHVAYWQNELICFYIGMDDKGEPLVWNQFSFSDFLYETFYVHQQGLTSKLRSIFTEKFPVVAKALGAMMVSLFL